MAVGVIVQSSNVREADTARVSSNSSKLRLFNSSAERTGWADNIALDANHANPTNKKMVLRRSRRTGEVSAAMG